MTVFFDCFFQEYATEEYFYNTNCKLSWINSYYHLKDVFPMLVGFQEIL